MDTLENAVISAIQSCDSLRLTVRGLPCDTTISKLLEQLDALYTALALLSENMSRSQDEFAELKPVVKLCGAISEDLKAGIKQASSSGLTDWANLECRGTNIAGVRDKLKIYTSTISIKMITVGS